jgi:hypothetical protein
MRAGSNGPFTGVPPIGSTPFTVPPWQSGQPSGPPTERNSRSWAIVDLPAVDPERVARQRHLLLRVAGGLIGFVVLLAILAGHC